ncbi:alpha/beta hydrolase family protein [Chitinimonas lacunae]|uniref:Prolyl oligopeptidase family serine peptidase n=1 Tax=Chitinimonas lacunae TaxID=1963018 RepID=A0ABV8MR44_9NEIS
MLPTHRLLLAPIGAALLATSGFSADQGYQLPPPELQALVDAPRTPGFSLGSQRTKAMIINRPGMPGIREVAAPELKLAGIRLNPTMRAMTRYSFGDRLTLIDIASGQERVVSGLPPKPRIADYAWSADERWFAFSHWGEQGVELWLVDTQSASARRLLHEPLNATSSGGFAWLGSSHRLLVKLPPKGQPPQPQAPTVPTGPKIQESRGGPVSQLRTYPDMLKTAYDADLLEWQLDSQLGLVSLDGKLERFGPNARIIGAQPSPDGQRVLVTTLHRPYSTLVPLWLFPQKVEIWDLAGNKQVTLSERPLTERIPPGNDAVLPGRRDFGWRADAPATVYWAEAQDEGDPSRPAKIRDALFMLAAPFTAAPQKLIEVGFRLQEVEWSSGELALVTEDWWKSRDTRTWRIQPDRPAQAPELLVERKREDRYADPGHPMFARNQYGQPVVRLSADGKSFFLSGEGASPEGDRPFVDRYEISSHKTTRLWRSEAPHYEIAVAMVDDERIVTSRESNQERPNYYLRHLGQAKSPMALTRFPHPTPQLVGVQKQLLRYKRADGVDLTGTLYLPPGYEAKRDGPLPLLMWAYPQEFKTAQAASQVTDSPYRFNWISVMGPQAMLARGYAVLDDPTMPIIGEGNKEPNDSYVEQLTASAKAAVDEVVRLGVADRDRIAIGGHSYGAFMTANLLAHTRLFRAGIARSGAYNRTLTPFGFQAEDRNFWQAQTTYQVMSPFNHADKIKDPLLLIHGETDSNPGTFPVQSERFFQALQGLGATARLVMLPSELHGYNARESVMHMLWEQDRWLDQYLKQAKPRESETAQPPAKPA